MPDGVVDLFEGNVEWGWLYRERENLEENKHENAILSGSSGGSRQLED